MAETAQTVARGIAAGRAALGLVLVLSPDLVTRRWVGADGTTPGGRALARGFGGRDVAIGVAGLLAPEGKALKAAVAAGIAGDLADAAAAAFDDYSPASGRHATLAVATSALVAGAWVLTQLD